MGQSRTIPAVLPDGSLSATPGKRTLAGLLPIRPFLASKIGASEQVGDPNSGILFPVACSIQHTVRYTELSPTRFRDFWR
jgi:hypothetical protein